MLRQRKETYSKQLNIVYSIMRYVLYYKGMAQYESQYRCQLESIIENDMLQFGSKREQWKIKVKTI